MKAGRLGIGRAAPAGRAPWGWAALGASIGILVTFLVSMPAQWVAARVASATEGRVLLPDARGTVWNGSARLVLTAGAGSSDATSLPSRVQWQLRPAWTGLRLQVRAECCTPVPLEVIARMGWRRTTLEVADGQSQWPAALLAGLGTPWNTLQFDGELALSTRGLSLEWAEGRMSVAGRAELLAMRMSSRLTTLRPMGSYRLVLAGGAVPTLQLSTLEGDLQLKGSGQWVGSRLRFTGEASASAEREAALSNLLNIIGRRNGARSIITIG